MGITAADVDVVVVVVVLDSDGGDGSVVVVNLLCTVIFAVGFRH